MQDQNPERDMETTDPSPKNLVHFVKGNLLEAPEQYICHQCNCITDKALGLAKSIFTAFPYADVYTPRGQTESKKDKPGTIQIMGNGKSQRYVINMFAQYYPGKPKIGITRVDLEGEREHWFAQCLDEIKHIQNLQSVAFPYQIGCGLAGGNWAWYYHMIEQFAQSVPHVRVAIYQL
jgi:O-acetyl-ADP-ribose deacetylase (regulator of RNase III)